MSDVPRSAPLGPAELDPEQREVYDAIANGPRAGEATRTPVVDAEGRLVGPFGAMLLSPGVGMAVQRLGGAIRFSGTLSPRAREVAILTVAAGERSGFEWLAHAAAAGAAGVADADIEAIRDGESPADPPIASVWRIARALHADGALADEAFSGAIAAVGRDGLAELVWLVGYYAMLATSLRVFDPSVPEAARELFEG